MNINEDNNINTNTYNTNTFNFLTDTPTQYGIVGAQDYDSYFSAINNVPLAVQFYYIDQSLFGAGGKNFKPFTHSGYVMNLLYMPFLDQSDVNIVRIPYDQTNLGSVNDLSTDPEKDVYVYKLFQKQPADKRLGGIAKYPPIERTPYKSWRNESKFYQYPYHFMTINDYINAPLKIEPKYIAGNIADVYVSQPISMTGGYTIYIPGYKGDKNKGANEGLYSSAGLDLPTSGTQYAQFMATSKNSFLQDNINASRSENYGAAKVYTGALGSTLKASIPLIAGIAATPFTGGASLAAGATAFGSIAGKGISESFSAYMDKKHQQTNRIDQSQAKINDILNSPRNVSMSSSDILMTMDRNNKQVVYNRYMITEYYRNKITDYWTLYGYKQNKLMDINLRSRKYFNYIKTIDANIIGNNLDKSELEAIKAIYDSGVTFWHYFDLQQNGLKMFDYHMDNIER